MAGGNRSAAYLMEWLGLPTLESSNDPDKPENAMLSPTASKTPEYPSISQGEGEDVEGGEEKDAVVKDESLQEALSAKAGPVAVCPPAGAAADAAVAAGKVAAELLVEGSTSGERFVIVFVDSYAYRVFSHHRIEMQKIWMQLLVHSMSTMY